MQINTQIN